MGWITESGGCGGLPYDGPTYSNVSSYASPPADSPDVALLALLACFGPAATLRSSLAIRLHRHGQFVWYLCRIWALPWLFLACERPRLRCVAHAGDGGYVGLSGACIWYTCVWTFPAYTALTVE